MNKSINPVQSSSICLHHTKNSDSLNKSLFILILCFLTRLPTQLTRISFQHKLHYLRNYQYLIFSITREESVSEKGHKIQKEIRLRRACQY